MGVLDDILKHKRDELARLRSLSLPTPPPARKPALKRQDDASLRLICEIKRRSPSAGPLSQALTVGERAAAYERAGATMISVLCDERFFDGSYEHLAEARRHCSLPLLAKEFVLDAVQLDLARAFGADAVLLIVRCLSDASLKQLVAAAGERELDALVEVTTQQEAERALAAGARWIGVNARDLDTLEMDPERARRVLKSLPSQIVSIHLSGLKAATDVQRVASSPVDAALLGETLMRQDDPEPLLASLVDAARQPRGSTPSPLA